MHEPVKFLRILLAGAMVFVFAFSGMPSFAATSLNINGNPEALVCDVLASIGLGCGLPPPTGLKNSSNSNTADTNGNRQDQSSTQSGSTSRLQASISSITVKRNDSDDEVVLVKIPANGGIKPTLGLDTDDAIFEIIKGQKHFIPTVDIFFDYGFDLSTVQSATKNDLDMFPRAKLISARKNKKHVYYVTENSMIRLIPNDKVFESYGNREEDIITISNKEFNFYPRNQYIFLEDFSSMAGADIFQISNDSVKRYVVPQVVKRLKITSDQVAPVNKEQFNAYNYGSPIIF
ncbi:MAG: hypothetical protein HYX22_03700 [Candidatus Yanofskybacteria bacterium]|nr:hypothetical protein [Candidatus Yanofskybacteria bacterium]